LRSIGVSLGPFSPPYPAGQKFAAEFWIALERQQLGLFLISLLVGAGSMAADNRSNALLVYLSKPVTKGDYLIGKWMGIFIPLFLAAAVPGLLLYLYGLMSFRSLGFVSDEPWLLPRMLAASTIPAAVHTSLVLGFSSWSKTPRIAGASYAGLYFVSGIISFGAWLLQYGGDVGTGILVSHMSVAGIISGMMQRLFGVAQLTQVMQRRRGMEMLSLDPPILWINLLALAIALVVGIALARARIKAVEVIQG
jgi:ABC-2 type transport system permease protein